tara:strand:+ start:1852 stop:2604 length:753 start_codon:yes stop_codon:yes gene_type:complete
MLLKHWPQKRKEWVIGGFLNILFILCIIGIRYYYAQEEMDFLRKDSERQDVMIGELQDSVDFLVKQNNDLLKDLHDHDKTRGIENKKLKEQMSEFQVELDTIKQQLSSKVSIYDNIKTYSNGSGVVPFEKEFGTQDSYLRIFGRTGISMVNDSIVDSETNIGFDGSIEQGEPFIEQGEVKGEWYAIVPETQFDGLIMKSRRSNPFKIKPPRNQISVGPFVGITYDQVTGLTEPVIGFGVTYNAFKVWDWR